MLQRLTGVLLAACVFVGLLWPTLATVARPLLMPSIFVLLVCTLLTLEPGDVRKALSGEGRLLGLICVWQLVALPVLTAAILLTVPISGELRMVLVLSACACPLFSSPAFARLLHLDVPLMTAIVLVTTFLMPLALLIGAEFLLTTSAELDLGEYLRRMVLFILLPFLLAALVRRVVGDAKIAARRRVVSGTVIAALMVFALAVMEGVTARFLESPMLVIGFLLAAFIYNVMSQLVTALVFRPAGAVRALTAGLAAGYRNLALVLAMTGTMVGPDFAIYVGVAQIPMYVLPMLLAPLYHRIRALPMSSTR